MEENLCNHLSSLLSGIVEQKIINSFVDQMSQIDQSGHFVEACKSLSQGFKHYLNGSKDPFALCSYYFKMVELRGAEPVYRFYKNHKLQVPNHRMIIDVLNHTACHLEDQSYLLSGLMKLHTAKLTDRKPSQSVIQKTREIITSPGPDIPMDLKENFRDVCSRFCQFLKRNERSYTYVSDRQYIPLMMHPANRNKRFYNPALQKSLDRSNRLHYDLRVALRQLSIYNIAKKYETETGNCLVSGGNYDVKFKFDLVKDKLYTSPISGGITMIPEVGNKYRTVAVPNAAILSLNYPLAKILRKSLDSLKTQGVKSHDKTTSYIQEQLNCSSGHKTFYSIDMSNFTDRYPYEYQRILLEEMVQSSIILDYDLEVQDAVVGLVYDFRQEPVRYAVGTPQGTYASFPLASLTHGLTAHMAFEKAVGGNKSFFYDLPFRVIGDDIVIYHDDLYNQYKPIMETLGVSINPDKTLISKHYAEMCSKWIDKDGVYLQKKIKPINSESSYIEAYNYYNGNLNIEKYHYLHSLPKPFGLLEPDPGDILLSYAYANKKYSEYTDKPGRKDFIEAFLRDDLSRDLYEVGSIDRSIECNPINISLDHLIYDLGTLLKEARNQINDSSLPLREVEDNMKDISNICDIIEGKGSQYMKRAVAHLMPARLDVGVSNVSKLDLETYSKKIETVRSKDDLTPDI